jgi:hydrogenase nickel incorporation protein HypA/HybF
MHELGITQSVVAIVAERAQGQKVLRVTLEVGKLAGLLPDAIRFCFDICSQGTPVQGALLQIIEPEGRGHCTSCGAEPVLHAPLGRCPACGAPTLRVVAGNELKIKEMETESCV